MDDALMVAIYVLVDDTMKMLGHRSYCLAGLSDAEVLTVAILAARYYGNHHARAVGQLTGTGYVPRTISPSRFNRRLHALADGLELFLGLIGDVVVRAQAAICDVVLDSLPLPACRRVRAWCGRTVYGYSSSSTLSAGGCTPMRTHRRRACTSRGRLSLRAEIAARPIGV